MTMTQSKRIKIKPVSEPEGGSFRHTLVTALITFLFTGIGAGLFSNWLSDISKTRDLQLAASRRAIDSVKSVTDLIFERDTRANFLVSAINRHASSDEIKERKRAYDDIFIRYNSTIQSNLFSVREIFHTADYTVFERLVDGPLRDLLMAEDRCATSAYDAASVTPPFAAQSSGSSAPLKENDLSTLEHCSISGINNAPAFKEIHHAILRYEYTYSDDLFRIVTEPDGSEKLEESMDKDMRNACQFPLVNKSMVVHGGIAQVSSK